MAVPQAGAGRKSNRPVVFPSPFPYVPFFLTKLVDIWHGTDVLCKKRTSSPRLLLYQTGLECGTFPA